MEHPEGNISTIYLRDDTADSVLTKLAVLCAQNNSEKVSSYQKNDNVVTCRAD